MGSIIGIPTTRVSDLFVRQRLLSQTQMDQLDLFKIETQLSTGHRFEVPSEDADASLRIISLQRLLERKEQVQVNLSTNQSYLTATDSALSRVGGIVADIRAAALGVMGTTATDDQRAAAAQQVGQALNQLMDTGNQRFRGRYLFAGTDTNVRPFELVGNGVIRYQGDEGMLQSYSDIDLLFSTNLNGSEMFGAVSEPVRSTVDFEPVVTSNTRLADLRGGSGIAKGSIYIAAGGKAATVDLSTAETLGDVAAMIRAGAPEGITLDLEVTHTGLKIEVTDPPGSAMSIREVGGGTTADELGILTETPTTLPITGKDLDPILRLTTPVDNIFGTRAYSVVRSAGSDNDIIFESGTVGDTANNIKIRFVDDGSVVFPGADEQATYDQATKTLTVTVKQNATRANHVVAAVEAAFEAGTIPLTARLDPLDNERGGDGMVSVTPVGENAGVTHSGSGTPWDKGSGLQISNGGNSFVIDFADTETVEDMLNVLNMADAGLLAEINEDATAINVRSRLSGEDFLIGENGGTTATDLGLRTFNLDTQLEDLWHGRGVPVAEGTDFTITIAATTTNPIEIDISGLETIGEVIAEINAQDPANLRAQLATYGNGIELVDLSTGANELTVTRDPMSQAAIYLGLIPEGEDTSGTPVAATSATTTITAPTTTSDIIFTAFDQGTSMNGLRVIYEDTGTGNVDYDPIAGTLTFGITDGVTTALDVINMLGASPAAAYFGAQLDPADTSQNDGTGAVDVTPATPPQMAGGDATTQASATVTFAGTDNDLIFRAQAPGAGLNGTDIVFNAVPGGPIAFNLAAGTLTVDFDPVAGTTAQEIIDALTVDPLGATFLAELDPTDERPNDGAGLVSPQDGTAAPMTGGSSTLTGTDVNFQETEGVFTALIRLQTALEINDVREMQRAIDMLDRTNLDLTFNRAELGARQQGLDIMQVRLEDEDVNLRAALSEDWDVDLVEAISNFSARQIALEASLRSTASIFQMTLLNYL